MSIIKMENTDNTAETVEHFLNTRLVNYASYDNLRKIASCIDGLKNASRKVMFTVLEKNIKENVKVLQLANKAAEYADYLHGDLSGVCVTLGQDFCGANNIPLLKKSGNFGTRSIHEASAPRYIFAKGSELFFKLFKKEDISILNEQFFEGNRIEPKFYVPVLPLLIINGSDGVSMGFAQKIMPRNPKSVKKYLTDLLSGKKPNKNLLEPCCTGFNGTIEKDLENTDGVKYLIKGTVKKIKDTEFLIEEIPYTYDLQEYLKVLDDLEESKFIQRYNDESDGENSLKFRVYISRANQDSCGIKPSDKNPDLSILMSKLKLVKSVTENYTCIDENLKIFQANSIFEIFDRYYNVKIEYLEKRKEFLLDKLNKSNQINLSKKMFIDLYIKGKLKINNVKKDDIIASLQKIKDIAPEDNYDYLLKMPLYSLTTEKLAELEETIKNIQDKIAELQKCSAQQMWLKDLHEI